MSDPTVSDWIRTTDLDHPETLRRALDDAFEFRGDVTIRHREGREIEGFLFDHRPGPTLETSSIRLDTPAGERVTLAYPDITEIRFTGRDAAAGRSWENWVRRYAEKKLAGEEASIESESLE